MANIKNTICSWALLFFILCPIKAQNNSTFTHTVKQGETLYSISKIYHTRTDDIIRLNPAAAQGIRTGSTLIIPQQKASDARQGRFHTIVSGETLYQLTKRYQVGIEELCKANPGLTVENFKSGMVIRIPEPTAPAATPSEKTATPPQGLARSNCREMHKVAKRETIFKIAREYNLTEQELKDANPEMKNPDYKLKKGEFICIPYPKPAKVEEKIPSNEELIVRKAIAPQKLIRMGVLLPLKSDHPESNKMIEFYRGVLMAVDSIKTLGVSVDVFAYDSGKTPADIQQIIQSHPLTNLDLILGPLYPDQITPLSNFCKKNKIKLIVPFSSSSEEIYNNPLYYAINPPKSFQQAEAGELTMELFKKDNFIFLDSPEKDEDAAAFTDTLEKRLQQSGIEAQTIHINGSEIAWMGAMNQFKQNIIIPNSGSIKLLNQIFPLLKQFSKNNPEYKIKLIGYPEWQTYTANHLENYFQFDTYVYSSFYRNPLSKSADQFDRKYQSHFQQAPIMSYPRFNLLGFDICFYFLKGIAEYGKAFEQHCHKIKTVPYQQQFNFERASNWSGFINKEIQFIHYTPSQQIELIRLKP